MGIMPDRFNSTSAPDPSIYRNQPPPSPKVVSVTTRQVPAACGACARSGKWVVWQSVEIDCEACHGKGWLMVTETTTVTQ